MKHLTRKSDSNYSWPYLLFVFFLTMLIAGLVAGYIGLRSQVRLKGQTKDYARIQAGRIKNVIDGQLSACKTVEALLLQGDGEIEDFDSTMERVIDGYDIHNISIAPNGVISQTYPLKGNEKTIGHDLLNDPARATEAKLAKESGKLTVSGPYELRQGGIGIIGRQPVFMADESGEEKFWGFVAITLKLPEAFLAAHLDAMEQQDYTYELWRIDPDTDEKHVIMKSAEPLGKNPVTYILELPNSMWMLSIMPREGWTDARDVITSVSVVLLISLLVTLLTLEVIRLADSRDDLERSIRQQAENYTQMNKLNEQLRVFRHDIKNHFVCISGLLEVDKAQEAREYIGSIENTFISHTFIFNTENYIFDALLAEKRRIAMKQGITMDCEISIPGKLKIENTDWSILYGNLLDNALEAAKKTNRPYVRITMSCHGTNLHTLISNTALSAPQVVNGRYVTDKADKNAHGIGFGQIQKTIKKYDGTLDMQYQDGMLTVSFLLLNVCLKDIT